MHLRENIKQSVFCSSADSSGVDNIYATRGIPNVCLFGEASVLY